MSVAFENLPTCGLEAFFLVGDIGEAHFAVDRDVVVVPQHDELTEFLHSCEADGFVADAFHQAAVPSDDVGIVIYHFLAVTRAQGFFGHREADGVGNALAEWAGGGFNAGGMAVFRVTSRDGAQLAEILDLLQRHIFVACEVKKRVKQHRTVARGQDEPVTVGPVRGGGVKLQVLIKEHGCNVRHAHRHTWVA